jgi:hypothetical protein
MLRFVSGLAAAAALVVPGSALAGAEPASEGPTPPQACKQERLSIGAEAFRALHGTNKTKSNALGKCIAKKAKARGENSAEAQSACRAEQGDPDFAASHDGNTFDQYYGTGKGRNAFGKCVSSKAKAANHADDRTTIKAARQCNAERVADAAAFKTAYGARPNAFGKCVSKKAKAQNQTP